MNSNLDAEIDLAGWHVGVVVRTPATEDEVAAAAKDAGEALKRAHRPGLVVLNLTTALPAPSRANRVDRDDTALNEMQSHLDRALVDRRESLAAAAGDLAFGLLACATMRTTTVSSARVAFATLFRGINLCEMDDPRIEKLAWFLERFAKG